jgi:uncharacterized membrane protein YkvA (DUF1232 family)
MTMTTAPLDAASIAADTFAPGDYKSADFTDFDFGAAGFDLREGTAGKYMRLEPDVPPTHEIGIGAYCAFLSQFELPVTAAKTLWKWLLLGLRRLMRIKRTARDRLYRILRNLDEEYRNLREQVKQLAEEEQDQTLCNLIFLVPDLLIYLARLIADPEVPKEYKVLVGIGLLYIVSPIDVIPEAFIPHPIAFADDAAVGLIVLLTGFDHKYVSEAKFKEHWPGSPDSIDNMKEWVRAAKEVLGSSFFERLRDYIWGKSGEVPPK